MEEAMTNARLRQCPDCKRRFFKTEGCNKMKCICGTIICYVCRQKIVEYDHFCSIPYCDHTSCGKCVLFSDSVQDDKRAVEEAALQEFGKLVERDASLVENPDLQALLTTEKKGGPQWESPQLPQWSQPPQERHRRGYLDGFQERERNWGRDLEQERNMIWGKHIDEIDKSIIWRREKKR